MPGDSDIFIVIIVLVLVCATGSRSGCERDPQGCNRHWRDVEICTDDGHGTRRCWVESEAYCKVTP